MGLLRKISKEDIWKKALDGYNTVYNNPDSETIQRSLCDTKTPAYAIAFPSFKRFEDWNRESGLVFKGWEDVEDEFILYIKAEAKTMRWAKENQSTIELYNENEIIWQTTEVCEKMFNAKYKRGYHPSKTALPDEFACVRWGH